MWWRSQTECDGSHKKEVFGPTLPSEAAALCGVMVTLGSRQSGFAAGSVSHAKTAGRCPASRTPMCGAFRGGPCNGVRRHAAAREMSTSASSSGSSTTLSCSFGSVRAMTAEEGLSLRFAGRCGTPAGM